MRRTVDYGLRHATSRRWLTYSVGVTGETRDVDEAKRWTSWDRADAFRRRYLASFADAWKVEPLPQPEPPERAA